MKRYLALVFTLCLLATCGPTPTDTPFPPRPAATETVLLEMLCEPVDYFVRAWLDENRNGIWDTAERPMADVRFHLEITGRGTLLRRNDRSDPEGFALMSAVGDGFDRCRTDADIYAEVPDGYEPTTPVRQGASSWSQPPALYGFAPLPDMTLTPAPE